MKRLDECPICSAPISEFLDGDAPGKRVLYFFCQTCATVFYPGWREQCWEDPATRPIPQQLANYGEGDGEQAMVFVPTLGALVHRFPRTVRFAVGLAAAVAILLLILNNHARTLVRILV
jgi:hypothetical protein